VVVIPQDPEVRRDTEAAARRFAAAVSGAVEGFVEAMEEFDVAEEARRSLETAGEVARSGGGEAASLAQTPEMQELGRNVGNAAQAARQAASNAADNVKAAAQDVQYNVREAMEDVRDSYENAKEEVKVRAEAVAETGRRARVAPRRIGRELRAALQAWWGSIVASLATMAALLVLGLTTFILLTIAIVVGLNRLLGDPGGTWLTVAIYVVAMIVVYAIMRASRARAKAEVRRRMDRSKAEIAHVTAPVRSAFSGRGRTGF
jgi:gas vesicle protein/membrane protein implicated in regulation of membrane protease activity